ncbi:hypothetical protein BGW41_007183 [Actinomortierella wolfii]|nr:hypothetical protein BGW41_007183 [Actinomortierella wolfii]
MDKFDNDIKRSNTGELENDDGRQHTPAVAAPASADATEDEARRGGPTDNKKANLSVTFEHHGRPRSPRMDSNTSESFPTYADYRQAQHGNFDAFAQRIKRAFLAATMAKPPTADPSSTFPSSPSSLASATSDRNGKDVQLSSISSSDDQLHPSTPSSGGKGGAGTKSTVSTGGRSRSTSAASVLSDIAEKIRSGTMLLGRSITQGGNQQSGSQSHIDRIDGGGSSHGHQHVVTGSFNHKPRARAVSDAGALQVAEMGNGPYHHVGHNSRPTRPSGLVRRSSSQLETISTGAKWDTGGGETGSTRNNTATTTATSYLAPYQPTQD